MIERNGYDRDKKGFTLIELLVVIAIIGLLMAVIIPAIQKAKNQAQTSVCLANVNGLIKCWVAYTVDNDDRLVGTTTRNPGPDDYSWVDRPLDASGNPVPADDSTPEDEMRGIENGLLYPYSQSTDSYHCPADRRHLEPCDEGTVGVGNLGWRTYGISAGIGVCSDSESQWQGFYPHIRSTTISVPGDKFVFVEEGERERGINVNSWVFQPQFNNGQIMDKLGLFHRDRSIMGYADGHAEKHLWRDEEFIKASLEGLVDDIWLNTDSEDYLYLQRHFTFLRED